MSRISQQYCEFLCACEVLHPNPVVTLQGRSTRKPRTHFPGADPPSPETKLNPQRRLFSPSPVLQPTLSPFILLPKSLCLTQVLFLTASMLQAATSKSVLPKLCPMNRDLIHKRQRVITSSCLLFSPDFFEGLLQKELP